eukprot:TRINITY_DN31189_c0_g1_i1.p1 TRINITY_DN31189_c0_g1~~TRINITY_DN31189_c0_g1_i1.p1  ORF type:complete len:156 (+),score=18.10 TRINITY_DN31189_c0_g1_i1:18-485(+)
MCDTDTFSADDAHLLGLISELASSSSTSCAYDRYLEACFAEAETKGMFDVFPEVGVLSVIFEVRRACRDFSKNREESWRRLQGAVYSLAEYLPDRTFITLSRVLMSVTVEESGSYKIVVAAYECTKKLQELVLEKTAMLTLRLSLIHISEPTRPY